MIADYESPDRAALLSSPGIYALGQTHKHLPEMKAVCGLSREPLFLPFTTDYYSGMIVQLPLYASMLSKKMTPEDIRDHYAAYYEGKRFIKVMPYGAEAEAGGVLFSDGCSGWDGMEIYVTGNEERIVAASRFDNLGKGASGAAIQCMNLNLGCDEAKGLSL